MFDESSQRPEQYRAFEREAPRWYRDAKLGIFLHWGPYSVPAWAEPSSLAGATDFAHVLKHMPYAEWYANTIRIPGSPAAQHHHAVYGDAPYDDFLDQWTAQDFDVQQLMALIASTGAGYFVPTTKHHDGVTLWDAPGTGDRNTVHRGPHRDLVGELHDAARAVGLRFGVYYSGGLDWHFHQAPAISDAESFVTGRPVDAAYAAYAYHHVVDLIDRYRPDLLWGDIDWPDAGKPDGPESFVRVLQQFYATAPDGVVNDRWGATHWDFRTSEYQHGSRLEGAEMWENTRGIGYSFGYNQLDTDETSLGGPEAIQHFVDVVSRGGNLLLNVGLKGDGTLPDVQRRTLLALAAWNATHGCAVFGSVPVPPAIATPNETPWVRWTSTGDSLHAFVVSAESQVTLLVDPQWVDLGTARLADGTACSATAVGTGVEVTLLGDASILPMRVTFDRAPS